MICRGRDIDEILRQIKSVAEQYKIIPLMRKSPSGEFSGHKPYSVGDDFRKIDFRASARRWNGSDLEGLLVKEFEEPPEKGLTLLIDYSKAMLSSYGGLKRIDRAITLAIGLSYIALSANGWILAITLNEEVRIKYIPLVESSRIDEQLYDLFSFLCSEKPKTKRSLLSRISTINVLPSFTVLLTTTAYDMYEMERIVNMIHIEGSPLFIIFVRQEKIAPEMSLVVGLKGTVKRITGEELRDIETAVSSIYNRVREMGANVIQYSSFADISRVFSEFADTWRWYMP